MSILRFSDGVSLDTSGPLRCERKRDGWYVLGNGMSIPMDSYEDAKAWIAKQAAAAKRGE